MFSKRGNGLRFLAIIQICFFMAAKLIHFCEKRKSCPGFFQSLSRMLWGWEEWMVGEIGGERERKTRGKGEWGESEKVNEVNGELGEFDEYAANGKKVKRSKGQKWLFVKILLKSTEQLKMSYLWIVHLNRGNDLAIVPTSSLYISLPCLSNNSVTIAKINLKSEK